MAWLHIETTNGIATIELAPHTTIGRDPTNLLVFADVDISSFHCILEQRGHDFVLRDVKSTNGTFVNDRRLAPREEVLLRQGDAVMVGKRRFRFSAVERTTTVVAVASPWPPIEKTVSMDFPSAVEAQARARHAAPAIPLPPVEMFAKVEGRRSPLQGQPQPTASSPVYAQPAEALPTRPPVATGSVAAPAPPENDARPQHRHVEHNDVRIDAADPGRAAIDPQRGIRPDGLQRSPDKVDDSGTDLEALSGVMGRGIRLFDEARGVTPYTALLHALDSEAAQQVRAQIRDLAQVYAVRGIAWSQKQNMSFFEKHIYRAASKDARDQVVREKLSESAGTAIDLILQGLGWAYGRSLQAKERRLFAEYITGVLMQASMTHGGPIPLCNQQILVNVLSALKVPPTQRKAILGVQKQLVELPDVRLPSEQAASVAHLAVQCAANHLGKDAVTKGVKRDIRALCEFMGLSSTEGSALVDDALRDYASESLEQHTHIVRVQRIVRDVGLNLRLDTETIRQNAARLAAFDPVKEERERNQWLILNVGGVAAAAGVGYLVGGPAVAAYVTGRGTCRVLGKAGGYDGTRDIDRALRVVSQANGLPEGTFSAVQKMDILRAM
jgi:hypothetical protein